MDYVPWKNSLPDMDIHVAGQRLQLQRVDDVGRFVVLPPRSEWIFPSIDML